MAGQGRVRSAGCWRRCGLRGGRRRGLRNLHCPRDPAALAGLLTACSFPPSVPAGHPPACRLLPASSLARPPGFRRSRRKLRHSQSPGLRQGLARASRSRADVRLIEVPAGALRAQALVPCGAKPGEGMLRPKPPGDSRMVCPIVPELDFTVGPRVPLLLEV